MALIKCPECSKEISDMAKSCPVCGFKLKINKQKKESTIICKECGIENQSKRKTCDKCGAPLKVRKKLNKKAKIIICCCILLIVVIGTITGIIIHKKNVEKDYNKLLIKTGATINIYGSLAEYTCYEIADVWHDAIWNKYNSDFNDDIEDYLDENESSIEKLKSIKDEIAIDMKKLKKVPNKDYEEAYKEIVNLYSSFSTLIDMASVPSGSYNQYSSKYEDAWKEFKATYSKIKILIPEVSDYKDKVDNVTSNDSI